MRNDVTTTASLMRRGRNSRFPLGRLVWRTGGLRCYEKQDGPAARLTLTRDGFPVLVNEYADVGLEALK